MSQKKHFEINATVKNIRRQEINIVLTFDLTRSSECVGDLSKKFNIQPNSETNISHGVHCRFEPKYLAYWDIEGEQKGKASGSDLSILCHDGGCSRLYSKAINSVP